MGRDVLQVQLIKVLVQEYKHHLVSYGAFVHALFS